MSTALVVGGGIGGLSAALCLAQQGLTVTVLEQSAGFGEIGAGIQLSPNCTRVLHHLGLAEPLRAAGFLPEGTEMRHWRRGHLIASNPLGDTVRERYGFPYYHIHRADLIRVLAQAAAEHPRITLHTGARVTAIEEHANGVRVHAGNASHEGAVLVGADGIRSLVREALFPDDQQALAADVVRLRVPARGVHHHPHGLGHMRIQPDLVSLEALGNAAERHQQHGPGHGHHRPFVRRLGAGQGRLDVGDIYNQIAFWQQAGLVARDVNGKDIVDLSFVRGHMNVPRS